MGAAVLGERRLLRETAPALWARKGALTGVGARMFGQRGAAGEGTAAFRTGVGPGWVCRRLRSCAWDLAEEKSRGLAREKNQKPEGVRAARTQEST